MKTKKVEITLTATTTVQYVEVVEVPEDLSPDELQHLVNDRYQTVGADEFTPVESCWERGDSRVADVASFVPATVQAVRVPGGLIAQELLEAAKLPAGAHQGHVVTEEEEIDFEPYLVGRLEVPYQSHANSALPPKAEVEQRCGKVAKELSLAHAESPVYVFALNRDLRDDHCVISVAVPRYSFESADDVHRKLIRAFGDYTTVEKVLN